MSCGICEDCGTDCGGDSLMAAQWYDDESTRCQPCAESLRRAQIASVPELKLDDAAGLNFQECVRRTLTKET